MRFEGVSVRLRHGSRAKTNLEDMSEAELAEYYYRHRDEFPQGQGEEVTSQAPKRLDVVQSIRLSTSEAERLRRAADKAGMNVSAYIRHVLLEPTQPVVNLARVRKDLARIRAAVDDAENLVAA